MGATEYTPVKRINEKQQTEDSQLPKEATPLKQPTFQNIVTPAGKRSSRGLAELGQLKEDSSLSRTQPHTAHKWLKSSVNKSTSRLKKQSRLDRSGLLNRSR